MNYRPTKLADRELTELAQSQAGYFTAKQAARFGYKYPHLAYHVKAGNFERAGHGLYRLPEIPLSEQDELVRLAFWSRNRDDQPQAVASHQTALAVHDLSDLLPSKIHLTVPLGFRKAAEPGVVLHRNKLSSQAVQKREGFAVTTPLHTLLDVANDKSIGDEHLQKAIRQAMDRGLVRKSKLLSAAKKSTAESRLSPIINTMS